jgi:hypothetical protein
MQRGGVLRHWSFPPPAFTTQREFHADPERQRQGWISDLSLIVLAQNIRGTEVCRDMAIDGIIPTPINELIPSLQIVVGQEH